MSLIDGVTTARVWIGPSVVMVIILTVWVIVVEDPVAVLEDL